MQYLTPILVSISTLLTGLVSAMIAYRAQSKQTEVQSKDIDFDHNESLLQGYSGMVDNLRSELERLNRVIDEMREDQEACDKRNQELTQEVNELRIRVSELEKQ